jgi:hypothetical protein
MKEDGKAAESIVIYYSLSASLSCPSGCLKVLWNVTFKDRT